MSRERVRLLAPGQHLDAGGVLQVVQRPEIGVEGAVVAGQGEHGPGVFHGGQDLLPVANDTCVLKQPGDAGDIKGRNPGNIKSTKAAAEIVPFILHHPPAKPGTEDGLGQLFQVAVIALRRGSGRYLAHSLHVGFQISGWGILA